MSLQQLGALAGEIPCAVAVCADRDAPRTAKFGVGPGARFQACSISKPVGAVTALSLVADGVLGLDDDVTGLLRSWRIPALGDWQPVVTLRHLLTHSAGLTVHGFPGTPPTQDPPTPVDILEGRSNTPAVVADLPPGLTARYSGGGYVALQVLLEDLTGRPYAELARERVLQPARMAASAYDEPTTPAAALRPDGRPLPHGPHRYAALVGGLWTTPADLVRFAQAVQAEALLPHELNAELLTEQHPGWGLGVELSAGGVFGHGGANEGYRCRLVADRAGAWSAAVMTGSDAGSRVCIAMLNALAQSEGWAGWEHLPVPADVGQWSVSLPGTYDDDRQRSWTVEQSTAGALHLCLPEQPPVDLELTGRTRCLIPAWDGELAVEWDGEEVRRIELRQAGLAFGAVRRG